MARGGKRGNPYRDANGRFASASTGRAVLGASRAKSSPAAARKAAKSQSGRVSTLAARSSLKRSRAKLAGRDPADQQLSSALSSRAQKAAVTRGNKALGAAKAAARTRLQGSPVASTISKNRSKSAVANARPINQPTPAVPARIANRSAADQAHRNKLAKQIKTLEKPLRRAMASIGMSPMGPLPGGRKFIPQLRPLTGKLRVRMLNERIRMDPYESTHLRQYVGEMVSNLLSTPSRGKNKLKPQERDSIVSSTINAIRKLNARAAINYDIKPGRKTRLQRPASTIGKSRSRVTVSAARDVTPRLAGRKVKNKVNAAEAASSRAKPIKPAKTALASPAAIENGTSNTLKLRSRTDGDAFAVRMKRASKIPIRRAINESDRENALSGDPRRAVLSAKRFEESNMRQARSGRTAAAAQSFYRAFGSPSTFGNRQRQSTANSPLFGSKIRKRKTRK